MGRGRPKGSKNKTTLKDEALEIKKDNTLLVALFGNEKEMKKEIGRLRKLKLQCRAGTPERIDLEHKIKALKKQRADISTPEPEKDPIIKEILKIEKEYNIRPTFEEIGISLFKYSLEQLNKHLECLKRKRGENAKGNC